MALQLTIGVDVEGNAKRELAAIDTSLKRIETTAKSADSPIKQVAKATDEWAEGTIRLSAAADKSADALAKEMIAITREDGARELAKKTTLEHTAATTGFTSAITAATTATGLSATTLGVLTAGLGTAAIASTALAAAIIKSTKHYFEHSEATKDSRDALASLSKGWEQFQMIVGGAVLGSDFTIAKPVQALNAALLVAGGYLAARINETKEWIGLLRAINPVANRVLGPMDMVGGDTPDVAGNTMSGQGLLMWQNSVAESMRWSSTSADAAQREWDEYSKGIEKASKELEKHNQQIRQFWAGVSPGWTGLTSMPGTSVGLPAWAAAGGMLPFIGGLGPGGASGMPGYETTSNPFGAGASIPLPLWVQAMARSSGLDIYEYWRQNGGGPDTRSIFSKGWVNPFQRGEGQGGADYANNLLGTGMALYQGGQDVWQNTGEGGAGKRALNGAMSGAQVGMMFGPWGAAIGAGVGALVGAIRGWLAPTEYEMRVRQEQRDRESATQMLASDPWLGSNWNALGGNMPFNFDFLKTQVQHDPSAIQGYLDDMVAKTERLNAAMERYGISWEDLGAAAKQSQIDQMAAQLIQDFEVLTLAGADVNFVIEKMGGSVNEFVQAAMRTGSEVPAAMKPMLERMIEMGLLVDENGNAFTSLEDSGIAFAQTMTEGFKSIVEAVNHLTKALGYDIPEAINKIPKDVTIDIGYNTKSPDYLPGPPEMPGTRPEHSPEAAMMSRAMSSRRELTVVVPVSIGGTQATEVVARTLLAG